MSTAPNLSSYHQVSAGELNFSSFAEKSQMLQEAITRLFASANSESAEVALEQLEKAVKVGVDINVYDANGNTLLHLAIKKGNLSLVQELLKRGADPNRVQLVSGLTPLHLCAMEGRLQIALLLIENHAHVDTPDNAGKTALMYAVEGLKKPIAHLLLLKGAQVDSKDKLGNTAFHCAAKAGDTFFIYLLTSAGANINAQNNEGKTALLIAAKDREVPMSAATGEVKRLLTSRFLMYPHWYLKKPKWTNGKSFQISFIGASLHVLFYVLLHYFGYLISSAVAGLLFFYWFKTSWPGPDERSTFFTNWTHSVFWSNLFVYFISLRENDIKLRPFENDLYVIVAFITFAFVQIMEWVKLDSGFISTTPEDDAQGFFEDVRQGRTEFTICSTCRIRRPLRSKHDQFTEACVARFDHYCFFTNQVIGAVNHAWFMWTLAWTWFTLGWFLRFAYHGLPNIFEVGWYNFVQHDRLLLYTTLQGGYFFYQMLQTWLMQAYFISLNYTTNEHINRGKYDHMKNRNPFDLGSRAANFRDWLYPSPPRKWFNVFYIDQLRPDLNAEKV